MGFDPIADGWYARLVECVDDLVVCFENEVKAIGFSGASEFTTFPGFTNVRGCPQPSGKPE